MNPNIRTYFSAVSQYYEAQVYDMFVIRGNTAIFKCSVPSFVSDYVYVESWEATNGDKYFIPTISDFGSHFRYYIMFISYECVSFLKCLINISYLNYYENKILSDFLFHI